MLFYQDFNEQFEGYTQPTARRGCWRRRCFIRISMSNLKDIHNHSRRCCWYCCVVLSGFQWAIWRIYTTTAQETAIKNLLFYQDFNEQFEGYTQRFSRTVSSPFCCFIRISMSNLKDIHNTLTHIVHHVQVVLSGFQWAIWRIYTTRCASLPEW